MKDGRKERGIAKGKYQGKGIKEGRMGWDGMGWDGMGWDGMGWDGVGEAG
jgi:hypothetical protein